MLENSIAIHIIFNNSQSHDALGTIPSTTKNKWKQINLKTPCLTGKGVGCQQSKGGQKYIPFSTKYYAFSNTPVRLYYEYDSTDFGLSQNETLFLMGKGQ